MREPVFQNTKLQFLSGVRGKVDAVLITMDPLVPPIRFERRPDAQLRDPGYLAQLAGSYAMQAGGELVVGVRGDRLTLELPRQPLLLLQPDRDHEFVFTELSARAFPAEPRRIRELHLIQPNGVFVATPGSW